LSDYVKMESDKLNYTGMVLSDLQKAFDTGSGNHGILLNKLRATGLNQNSIH